MCIVCRLEKFSYAPETASTGAGGGGGARAARTASDTTSGECGQKPDFFPNVTKLKLSIVQRQECFLSASAHRTSQDVHTQTKLLRSKSYLHDSGMHLCFSSNAGDVHRCFEAYAYFLCLAQDMFDSWLLLVASSSSCHDAVRYTPFGSCSNL